MMQTAEKLGSPQRRRRFVSVDLRRLFIQPEVNSDPVVLGRVGLENPTQVRLAGYHQMIEAFVPNRPD